MPELGGACPELPCPLHISQPDRKFIKARDGRGRRPAQPQSIPMILQAGPSQKAAVAGKGGLRC